MCALADRIATPSPTNLGSAPGAHTLTATSRRRALRTSLHPSPAEFPEFLLFGGSVNNSRSRCCFGGVKSMRDHSKPMRLALRLFAHKKSLGSFRCQFFPLHSHWCVHVLTLFHHLAIYWCISHIRARARAAPLAQVRAASITQRRWQSLANALMTYPGVRESHM